MAAKRASTMALAWARVSSGSRARTASISAVFPTILVLPKVSLASI